MKSINPQKMALPNPGGPPRSAVSALALTLVLSALAPAAWAAPGAWEVQDTTSAMDGQKSYAAYLQSDGAVTNIIGRPERAVLSFACDKDKFWAMIQWPDFISKDSDDSNVAFRWKLDAGAVEKASWFGTTKSMGARGDKGFKWMKALAAGKSLIVQVPDGHGGQEATFSLEGVSAIYGTLLARGCA